MTEKKVSIIVPVYNSELYLSRTLDSILNQTYKNLQVVLVNDGSKDSSGTICDEYAKKDKRIVVIHKKNGGVSSARNEGLKMSTGEYVEFVDSDDYLEKNCVETLVNKIKDCDLAICGFFTHSKSIETSRFDSDQIDNYKSQSKKFMQIVTKGLYSSLWNKLYRRELINCNFDKNYFIGEDVIFNMNYLQNCKNIATIKDCLYHYNFENSDSIMHTKIRDEENFTKYWTEIYTLCEKYFDDKEYVPILNGLYIKATMSQIINITIKKKLSYKDYKRIFNFYRDNTNITKALKHYKSNVFHKNNFIRKISILVFKFKFKFLFSLIIKIYNKSKKLTQKNEK